MVTLTRASPREHGGDNVGLLFKRPQTLCAFVVVALVSYFMGRLSTLESSVPSMTTTDDNTGGWSSSKKSSLPQYDLLPHLRDCDKEQSPLSLAQLAEKYKPSKFYRYAHTNYERIYPQYLEAYRFKYFKMLEIGLDTGNGTLLWQDYFPCATLVGLEYEASNANTRGAQTIHVIQGDQGDAEFLNGPFYQQATAGGKEKFDVIVDDGGHHFEQQITSYKILFDKALNPGGLYLMEDIETSYWKEGTDLYGLPISRGGQSEPGTVINRFKQLVDVVNKKFFDNTYTVFGPVDFWVATVGFMSNLIILTKKDKSHCRAEKQYIWQNKLADDCPAQTQSVQVVKDSPLVNYCGKEIIARDTKRTPGLLGLW